jgi:hypothetical protein
MVFLIEYARTEGRLVAIHEYRDDERLAAEEARLELELKRNREGIGREIVLLDASDKDALLQTHSRYFPVEVWPDPGIEWPEGDLPDQTPEEP